MERTTLNFLTDVIMFVIIFAIGIIGFLLGFIIPTGGVPPHEKYLWGLHRHDWGNIHLYLSLFLLALLVVHLILHWSWIKATSKRYFGSVAALWALAFVPFIIVFLLWMLYPDSLKHNDQPARERRASGELNQAFGPVSQETFERRGRNKW